MNERIDVTKDCQSFTLAEYHDFLPELKDTGLLDPDITPTP